MKLLISFLFLFLTIGFISSLDIGNTPNSFTAVNIIQPSAATTISGGSYNITYATWAYNQTLPAITSLNLSYNKWWYNQSTNLTSTTYYPTNSRVTGGSYTDSTNITKAWYYDGQSLNFTEGVGADPLDIYLNFTGVTSFNQIIMREYYLGSASHYIQVQVWNYDHNMWEEYFDFVGQAGMTILSIPVYDPAEHVSGGLVQLRLHHIQNGISSHRLYLDFVWLVDGITVGGSTNLDDYAKYSFSFNNFNGNGNFNTSANVSASYFKGDGSLLTGLGGSSVWNSNATAIWNNTVSQVGIGTATPTHELNVVGDINVTDNIHGQIDWVYVADTHGLSGDQVCSYMSGKNAGFDYTCTTCFDIANNTASCSGTIGADGWCGCKQS